MTETQMGDPCVSDESRRPAQDQGFTLMEMVIAVFIVAVMIAVITPHLMSVGSQAQTVADQESADAVKSALTEYYMVNHSLPTGNATEQIQALVASHLLAQPPGNSSVFTIDDTDPNNITVTCAQAAAQ